MTENVVPGKAPTGRKPVRNVSVPSNNAPVAEEVVAVVTAPVKTTTTRQIVSEGEKFEVEVVNINGKNYLAESVYRTVPLRNSKRTTQVLVVAKGSVIQG